jgi:hypothetical protein
MESSVWSRFVAVSAFVVSAVTACHRGVADDAPGGTWAWIGHQCPDDAPATALSLQRRDSLPPDPDSANSDGRWARISRLVPGGWGGGIFLDSGVAIYYLRDTTQRIAAEAVLNQYRVDGQVWGPPMHVRRGRWSFAELYDWDRYLRPRIGPSMSSADIDEAHNRLLYGVTTAAAKREFERQLAELGVPCFLVAIEIHAFAVPARAG